MRLGDIWPWSKAEYRWRILGKTYEVKMTEKCQRQFDELPPEAQEAIRKAIKRIARNPYSGIRHTINEKEYGVIELDDT